MNSETLEKNERLNVETDNSVYESHDNSMIQPDETPCTTSETAAQTSIEITLFKKSEGVLSKTITAGADGAPVSDGSACRMSSGEAKRMPLPDGERSLADLINNMASNEALALGRLTPNIGEAAPVSTMRCLQAAPEGTIARSGDYLEFMPGAPTFMLLDVDFKGMPQEIRDRVNKAGGIVALLIELFPKLMKAARVERASTSAGVSNTSTGQTFSGSGGMHIYVLVEDGADIPRALATLHERLWLNGCGWLNVGAVGQVLVRSLVDQAVGSPERVVFEGAPIVKPPLVQDVDARRATVSPGGAVETRNAIPELSEAEREHLRQIRHAHRNRIEATARTTRVAADQRLSEEISKRDGLPIEVARRQVEARHRDILMPGLTLVMDDDELGTVMVADVLRKPETFVGETLADPLEGPSYGRCKAMIMQDSETGGLYINSFAHGGARYRLCYDRKLLEELLRATDSKYVIDIFVAKEAQSHLESNEESSLIDLVAAISGLGKRAITKRLEKERAHRWHEQRARKEATQPVSSRPVYQAPANDAELSPTMQLLDDVLGKVVAIQPPMRGLTGALIEIRKSTPLGLHALTSKGTESDQQSEGERIPAPPEPLIHELTNNEVILLLERHMKFQVSKDSGIVKTVRLGAPFVSAYRAWHGSKLPICAAVSTSPFVSPITGAPVAGVGLDRDARVFYEIDPALLRSMPDRATITDEDAIKAYKFLTDEWLVDVTTNANGKAVAIAGALTMIQRIALDQRPAFFIVAPQRGGGKTTLASMITMAALGRAPAAAAWAMSEDERRKALLSYLRMGAACIVWDNIPRGESIKCPHVERALTSAEYTDRVLGVSEKLTVPSLTVMFFTGNNIAPTGDLASRSLVCSIDVTRIDPENRSFTHPDPLGWTAANRMRLMRAFYTLLLWNPYLRLPADQRVEAKTRFKAWWASIGAPIEAVTNFIGAPVDFNALFAANEAGDEEAGGVATICDAVRKKFSDRIFTVKEFSALLDPGPAPAGFGTPAEQAERKEANEMAESLRAALQSIHDVPLPSGPLPNQRIGQILGKALNRPVRIDGKTVRLRLVQAGHAGRTYQLEVL
jgi:hypothetical protein